ncbi:hypothetical protein [Atopococcus tabaci]|uniref:hypothetical protein n=1 Tax=Atopococcus tabaci TaxID=269774 RepID=UPI002408F8A8|nr:hypothetical protein [Atopococcus tabaci]
MLKNHSTLTIGIIGLILGFLITYFDFNFLFLIALVVVTLLVIMRRPRTPDTGTKAQQDASLKRFRDMTVAGLMAALGAVLAFILKYYIIGVH